MTITNRGEGESLDNLKGEVILCNRLTVNRPRGWQLLSIKEQIQYSHNARLSIAGENLTLEVEQCLAGAAALAPEVAVNLIGPVAPEGHHNLCLWL